MKNNKYNHKLIEENKYDFWLENQLFEPKNNLNKKPFSIILPPPNVTGKLHLGHAWDASYQDMLIRYKKLCGFDVLWVPGTDHAGIATQTKFEKILKEEHNLTRYDFSKEEFLNRLWNWKEEQAKFIRSQWKKLGLALSYKNEKFTMDKDVNTIVNKVFVDLYNKQLIYKSFKLVNWDTELKTAISNIEVIYKETKSKMYYFKYYLEDCLEFITVATTRPETMFGDVCLFVNPNDPRFLKYKNKKFINPVNNELIPLFFDEYIDVDFGTGVMKCTPAHDFNDYELYKKHSLELIKIMNEDGTLNDKCLEFKGIDRLKARDLIVAKLEKQGLLVKIENITNNVGYSERTNTVVEPLLSEQWFLKMQPLADKIISKQNSDSKIQFLPNRFNKTLLTWLENIEDWCISRQLWWGHQLPIWYNKETREIYCDTKEPKDIKNWTRDDSVLDTWFSSSLWPLVCLGWETNNEMFNRYFPSDVLVTGYDIIFFWVSRMIAQSLNNTNEIPFKNVLIHGLIRDENGKKMSKSLGNGIDPMEVIEQYGADALRMFLTSSSTLGEDLNFSYEKLSYYWNFNNKLWNGFKFIKQYIDKFNFKFEQNLDLNKLSDVDINILDKLNKLIKEVTKCYETYNFVVSTKELINFVWNEFNNNYLELCKNRLNNNDIYCLNVLIYVLKASLIMLHPQAPFITEEIYKNLFINELSIMQEEYPKQLDLSLFTKQINNSKLIFDLYDITKKIRTENNIANKTTLNILIETSKEFDIKELRKYFFESSLSIKNDIDKNNSKIYISENLKVYLEQEEVDSNKQIEVINNEINKVVFELERAKKMLSNENFVNKAKKELIQKEEEKIINYSKKLEELNQKLLELKNEIN